MISLRTAAASLTLALGLAVAGPAMASPVDGSYTLNTLPPNDDGSTGSVSLGFSLNYFGTTYTVTSRLPDPKVPSHRLG